MLTKHAFTPQGARWADISWKYVLIEPQRCENMHLTWGILISNLLWTIERCSDSESLILILIPGLKSLIPIPIPIPLYFDILDSDSDSSKKWNHSGILSDSGIVHHCPPCSQYHESGGKSICTTGHVSYKFFGHASSMAIKYRSPS